MPSSRLDCPLSLKTPNMGNTGLRSVGGHGPRWVQQVIEERDLATDPDLERARKFVREIWQSKQVGAP